MRKAITGMILLLMAVALPATADEEAYNFLKQGYSFFYETDLFGAVGMLEPLQTQNPPFDFDFETNEVTWAALDLVVVDQQVIGDNIMYQMAGGSIAVYEDPGFDLDYGGEPADGIATATNGTLALVGEISSASMIYNTASLTGTFIGEFVFTGGTRYDELGPLGDAPWNIFDGVSSEEIVNVPPGYHSRFAGRMFAMVITPAEETSWSQIRALYE